MRRDRRHHDRGMRLLVRLEDRALPDLGDLRIRGRDREELPRQVVGRAPCPDVEHHVDRLEEDGVAVLLVVAEGLGVRHQAAGADAHDEAALQQVIDHRHLRRDVRGVRVRHVDGAAAEHDVLRVVREAGEEHQARGDVLSQVRDVLADQRLAIAEPVGKQDRFAVFGVGLRGLPLRRVQRHHEHAEFHGVDKIQ